MTRSVGELEVTSPRGPAWALAHHTHGVRRGPTDGTRGRTTHHRTSREDLELGHEAQVVGGVAQPGQSRRFELRFLRRREDARGAQAGVMEDVVDRVLDLRNGVMRARACTGV